MLMNAKNTKEDPFNFLGFGMVAYRDLMVTLIALFTFLTVLMIPTAIMYGNHEGIINPTTYQRFSLGNMGYSSTQCQRIPYDLRKITLFCPYGFVTNIRSIGINPEGSVDRDSCVETE